MISVPSPTVQEGGRPHECSVASRCGYGTLDPSEFVAVTSTNTAEYSTFIQRRLNVGADADVFWDPEGTRVISAETHHQNIDFNIYEGMEVKGIPAYTLSRGRVVW